MTIFAERWTPPWRALAIAAGSLVVACAAHEPAAGPPAYASAAMCASAPASLVAPPARLPSPPNGCAIIERAQETALRELPGAFFSPDAKGPEPLLDALLFRRCQRATSGTIGLVPTKVEPGGIVTLHALLVEPDGQETSSRSLRVTTPREWEIVEAGEEPLVVLTASNNHACERNHPCTSSAAHLLRFADGRDDLLAPIAEQWLGTKAPFADADEDTPLPWRFVIRSAARDDELISVKFQWPSLRVGTHLYEGADGDADIDRTLGVTLDSTSWDCDAAGPIASSHTLWKSAQCERLRGANVADVLTALRRRCEWALTKAARGEDNDVLDDALCVDADGRAWLDEDVPSGPRKKPRPPVRLEPAVEKGLARMGTALKAAATKKGP
jgi:hypothetical protein